jgi:hypothetical protein
VTIEVGHALGYRRGREVGTWIARRYDPSQTPDTCFLALGAADDHLDADGAQVLNYSQAMEAARRWFSKTGEASPPKGGAYDVSAVLDAYFTLKYPDEKTAGARNAKSAIESRIRPELGKIAVAKVPNWTGPVFERSWRIENSERIAMNAPGSGAEFVTLAKTYVAAQGAGKNAGRYAGRAGASPPKL